MFNFSFQLVTNNPTATPQRGYKKTKNKTQFLSLTLIRMFNFQDQSIYLFCVNNTYTFKKEISHDKSF